MDDLVYYLVTTYRFSWVRYVDHCIFFIKIVIMLIISYFNFIWAYFGTICMETFDCWTCHCYETLHLCPFAIPIGFTSVQVFHTCLSEDKLNTHVIWSCSITIFVNIVNYLVNYFVTFYRFSWIGCINYNIFLIKIVIIIAVRYFDVVRSYFKLISVIAFNRWTYNLNKTLRYSPFTVPSNYIRNLVFYTRLSKSELDTLVVRSRSFSIFINIFNFLINHFITTSICIHTML